MHILKRFRGTGRRARALALALACLAACRSDGPRPATSYTARPVLGSWLLGVTAGESAWGFYLYLPEGYDDAVGALRVPATPGLREIPIWIFHDFDDDHEENSDPAFRAATGAVDALAGYPHAGGDPARPAAGDYTRSTSPTGGLGPWRPGILAPAGWVGYTLYATGGHDAWTRTYADEEVWRWMYAQFKPGAGDRANPGNR